MTVHRYRTHVRWTGNRRAGTASYGGYDRTYDIMGDGKSRIAGSSDPAFRGDATRWNPEELLVASLSACHQLWFLHLCAGANLVVVAYEDDAEGQMEEESGGGGQFREIVLHPKVTLAAGSDAAPVAALHEKASRLCFIERTLNCQVLHKATTIVAPA